MPVPFEALLPYAILIGMFGVTGVGLASLRTVTNDWKRPRHNLDQWDRNMMERDARLTGRLRGQATAEDGKAPRGFELSSTWKLEERFL